MYMMYDTIFSPIKFILNLHTRAFALLLHHLTFVTICQLKRIRVFFLVIFRVLGLVFLIVITLLISYLVQLFFKIEDHRIIEIINLD